VKMFHRADRQSQAIVSDCALSDFVFCEEFVCERDAAIDAAYFCSVGVNVVCSSGGLVD
jgi:hypothetical protein